MQTLDDFETEYLENHKDEVDDYIVELFQEYEAHKNLHAVLSVLINTSKVVKKPVVELIEKAGYKLTLEKQ